MSERRKRAVRVSGDSEEFSEESEDVEIIKASEGESEHDAGGLRGESEYESADSDDEAVHGEQDHLGGGQEASSDVNEEEEEGVLDEEEDELLYGSKREDGDGQESIPSKEKKLDDDEDRRNPQYIPKRGTFYEHDDRTAEDQEEEAKKEEPRKKKVWKENDDRWSHDKFNESDQAPKSHDELVASYGYDIRSEEGPPRARRRRRYGRGPNKYDRNWEDENAYSKPVRGTRGGGGPRRSMDGTGRGRRSSGGEDELVMEDDEEFPALSAAPPRKGAPRGRGSRGGGPHKEQMEFHRQQYSSQKITSEPQSPPLNDAPPQVSVPPSTPPAPTNHPTRGGRGGRGGSSSARATRGGSGRFVENRGRGRGQGSNDRRSYPGPRDDGRREIQDDETHLETNLKNLSIQDAEPIVSRDFRRQQVQHKNIPNYHQANERRQANVPPRLQQDASANRPKRYSSQRQRSLPESASNNYEQQGYYEQGYQQQHAVYAETAQPPPQQPNLQAVAVPVSATQAQSSSQILPPPPPGPAFGPSYPSPPPAAYIPHAQPPPQAPRMFAPAPQPAPSFLAPTGSMINYVPTPPAQFAPTYPPFQSFPPVVSAQPPPPQAPTELFVPNSGITYYSTQNQVPRPTPLKRPKAAIPIVPPPPKEKGRNVRQESSPTPAVTNKEDQQGKAIETKEPSLPAVGQLEKNNLATSTEVAAEIKVEKETDIIQTPVKEIQEKMAEPVKEVISPEKVIEIPEKTVDTVSPPEKEVQSIVDITKEVKNTSSESASVNSEVAATSEEQKTITSESISSTETAEVKPEERSEPQPTEVSA